MASSESDFFLLALNPDSISGKEFHIPMGRESASLGRGVDCDLSIEHPSLSWNHAKLRVTEAGQVEIEDQGSSNGTFLNGNRVERVHASQGDSIRFADVEFRLLSKSQGYEVNGSESKETEPMIVDMESHEERVRELEENLRQQERKRQSHEREAKEASERADRIKENLSEARREAIQREGVIAHLEYELKTKGDTLERIEERLAKSESLCKKREAELADLRKKLSSLEEEKKNESEARKAADGAYAALLTRLRILGTQLLKDWQDWISGESKTVGTEADADSIFTEVETVAKTIRGELDLIEPIWHRYGSGVQAELKRRSEVCRTSLSEVEEVLRLRRGDLESARNDLAEARQYLDSEVRRVHGLSRKSLLVEVPRRFEAMLIPRDRELEVYRALLDQIEEVDRIVEANRSNKSRSGIARELAQVSDTLMRALATAGVEPFQVEVGVILTPKDQERIRIMEKKGWGVKDFLPKPFMPGKVTRVVRPGYQIASNGEVIVLRKVEVLVRGSLD